MKVEINGKTYCVETLIADNERLRKEIIESADTIRLVLDSLRAEIEQITDTMGVSYNQYNQYVSKIDVLQIIDKYKAESEE